MLLNADKEEDYRHRLPHSQDSSSAYPNPHAKKKKPAQPKSGNLNSIREDDSTGTWFLGCVTPIALLICMCGYVFII